MADITAETIQKILDISKPEPVLIKDAHGIETTFAHKAMIQVKASAPETPGSVEVVTLSGFADLVAAKLEGAEFITDYIVHIENEQTVTLKARVSDDFGRRQVLVAAKPVPFDRFKFGVWYAQESFAIALASLFADTPDRAYVLNTASVLINEATQNSEDDGFTQKATIKRGLITKESVTLKPRVDLAPFRTFPEIEQPVSSFVFRARCADDTPALMLVEADGGRWKVDAIAKIAAKIAEFNLNIPVIA